MSNKINWYGRTKKVCITFWFTGCFNGHILTKKWWNRKTLAIGFFSCYSRWWFLQAMKFIYSERKKNGLILLPTTGWMSNSSLSSGALGKLKISSTSYLWDYLLTVKMTLVCQASKFLTLTPRPYQDVMLKCMTTGK